MIKLRYQQIMTLVIFVPLAIPVMSASMRSELSHQNVYAGQITNVYSDLESGLYLVHATISNPANVRKLPTGYRLVAYSYEHLTTRDGEQREVEYLILKNTADVRLTLAGDPEISTTNDRYEHSVGLSLNEEAAQQLQKFTATNLMRKVALVAGGKILTTHKIKSEIIGGKLQITRCNDNGCQYIYNSLRPAVGIPSTLR